jgi:predicted DNA-binding protein (MmcQ/YjbR family)
VYLDIIREHCLSKPGATEDFPFDETTLVFRVGNKMFALTDIEDKPTSCNLKCEPERAIELRERYEGIKPGWHMNKKYWNTVSTESDVDVDLMKELIDHSYDLIFSKLSKKVRAEIVG